MNVLKQVLGVDVAKKELVVTLGFLDHDLQINLNLHRVFSNKDTGFTALLKWLKKNTDSSVSLQIVMEATGVYHQKFANFLIDNDLSVCIVLPNKISSYMRTLETKTITDKTCSEAIAHFGLSRKLENWKKPNKLYKNLQQLTRERDQLVNERSMIKNQIHAEESEGEPNTNSIKRFNDRIKFINRQEREIKEEITQLTNSDKTLKQQIERMTTIPGIGELTAVTILAETNGFELIRNKKQLSSYAGFDIKEKQSGTSVKGKPRISKRGNRYLRKCMHLPSLSAVKKIDVYKDLYIRIVSKNGVKMKGLIAVQRKLLELTFIIFKNNSAFEQDYEIKKKSASLEENTLTS